MKKTLTIATLALCYASYAQMPDMAPPKEMANLNWLLGTWTGNQEYSMGEPGAKPEKGSAKITFKKALGGRFINGDHDMMMMGMKMTGTAMLTYDPSKKVWREYWFDSMTPEVLAFTGGPVNGEYVLTSEPVAMNGMPETRYRASYAHKAGKMVFKLQMQAGENWQTIVTGTYTKVAAKKR